jgi:tubulin beta
MGEAPLLAPKSMATLNLSVQELVAQSFSGNNYFSKVHPDGKHLACALIFRGDCAAYDIDEQLRQRQLKIAEQFVEWIPNNLKSASVFVPSLTSHRSSTFISNTTSIKSLFGRMSNHFSKLFKRKAFLHWYMEEGMDTDEFSEAIKNVQDLITEYQDKEQAVYDEDAEDDEDLDSEEY